MANKYLEKIAAEKKKQESGFRPGSALLASMGGDVIAAPLVATANHFGFKLLNNLNEAPASGADMGTVKKMMRDQKLDVTFKRKHPMNNKIHSPAYFHHSALYKGEKNFIGGVRQQHDFFSKAKSKPIKNVDVIMHELGHAQDFKRFGKTKMAIRGITSGPGQLLPTALLAHDKTREYAPAAAVAMALPTLRDEMAANHYAKKAIIAHKGKAAGKAFMKTTGRANMLNYSLSAAAQVGAAYAGKKILDYTNPIKRDK